MAKKEPTLAQMQRQLDDLQAALAEKRAKMTSEEKIKALADAQPHIEPGTPEMEALLQTGYGMTIEEAERIIKERDEDPVRWPLEEYRKAQAMLAAYNAKAEVVSEREGWHRTRP